MKSSITLQKSQIRSIAIGGFDGMHRGHQALFNHLNQNESAIVVIETGYANLTPKAKRQNYTSIPLVYYPLDSIKHFSGEEFIKILLEEFPILDTIVVGFDFCFGANRKYCIHHLKELFKGNVVVIEEVFFDDIAVHSRIIREYLSSGEIEIANKLLDKPYCLEGQIIKGQGLGKKQFVPTININVTEFLIPDEGIYATKTLVENQWYDSVSFIGHRVTTDGKFAVETHIIDQDINIDQHNISIQFFTKLRNNQKYDHYEELKKQILLDIQNAKNYLLN